MILGPPGTGKSHLAHAIGFAVIQQGHRVLCREAHALLDDLADAQLAGSRKEYVAAVTTIPLLIIDDLGMRKLPQTAAEDLLELVMRRYEKASTLITSNGRVEDWASSSATPPPSPRCSIGCSITPTCSPVARSWRTRLHSERNAS